MRAVGVGRSCCLLGPCAPPQPRPSRHPSLASSKGTLTPLPGPSEKRPETAQAQVPSAADSRSVVSERSSSSSVCPSSSRPLPSSQTYDPWLLLAYLGPREGHLETPQQGLSAGGHAAASGGISGGHDSGRAHLASGGWRPGCHYTSRGTQDSPHPTGRSPPRGRESPARKARSAQSQVRPPCSRWTLLAFPTCVRSSN